MLPIWLLAHTFFSWTFLFIQAKERRGRIFIFDLYLYDCSILNHLKHIQFILLGHKGCALICIIQHIMKKLPIKLSYLLKYETKGGIKKKSLIQIQGNNRF